MGEIAVRPAELLETATQRDRAERCAGAGTLARGAWSRGDSLSGKEILATTAGGALVAAGLIVVLAGAAAPRSLGTIAVGIVLLAAAGLALAPWLRGQRSLWRDVAALRRRERALRADLPPGADPGPGVLGRYYRRRLAPPFVAVALVAAWLLALRLSR